MSSQFQRRLLIIGPAWVGDMIMAQSLFKLLKSTDPHIQIDVLAPEWTVQLVQRMPEVSQGILFPFKHGELNLRGRFALAKQLREKRYQQVIVLTQSLKSALVPWWAKISIRTGWLGEWRFGLLNDVRYLDKKHFPLMIQRFMALGLPNKANLPHDLPSYYPALTISKQQQDELFRRFDLNVAAPIIALCPGAEFGPSKQWPVEYFAEVAKQKLKQGWQVWIFGSAKDGACAAIIQRQTDNQCIDLCGKTSLLDVVDLMACASAVVCNDSGLMHLAASLSRPLVVPYGSTSPSFTPPLSDQVAMINLGLPCSPCFKRTCPLGHTHCLVKIEPKQLLEALDGLVN